MWIDQNRKCVAGIDETGRGPFAGPMYVCCCIVEEVGKIKGVTDSKKLEPKEREELYWEIEKYHKYFIETVSPQDIDQYGLQFCFKRSLDKLAEKIPEGSVVYLDGNLNIQIGNFPTTSIVQGDSKVYSVACASIVAKVLRDKYMVEQAKIYPEYNFEENKGYGTKDHIEAIEKYGTCPIHRESFLKNVEYKTKGIF